MVVFSYLVFPLRTLAEYVSAPPGQLASVPASAPPSASRCLRLLLGTADGASHVQPLLSLVVQVIEELM